MAKDWPGTSRRWSISWWGSVAGRTFFLPYLRRGFDLRGPQEISIIEAECSMPSYLEHSPPGVPMLSQRSIPSMRARRSCV